MNRQSGQLFNIWEKSELDEIIEVMRDIPTLTIDKNECKGIDENHIEYYWFLEMVFKRLQNLFEEDILPVFGMFLNETKPWGIHTDAYHCDKFPDREPALSILIPYSLNNSVDNLKYGYTLVFNEYTRTLDEIKHLPDVSSNLNSALQIYDEHLSHNQIETVKKVTVKNIYPWVQGSVIYWDSLLLHDSNNFLRYGMESKQAIVVHTYRKK